MSGGTLIHIDDFLIDVVHNFSGADRGAGGKGADIGQNACGIAVLICLSRLRKHRSAAGGHIEIIASAIRIGNGGSTEDHAHDKSSNEQKACNTPHNNHLFFYFVSFYCRESENARKRKGRRPA